MHHTIAALSEGERWRERRCMDLCRAPSIALENSPADFDGLSVDDTNDRLTDQFIKSGTCGNFCATRTRCQFAANARRCAKETLVAVRLLDSIHDVWKAAHPKQQQTHNKTAKR